MSYAGFGSVPIVGPTSPVSISDARLDCQCQAEAEWLISRYQVTPIFVNEKQLTAQVAVAEKS
jgi:hypothetical protein